MHEGPDKARVVAALREIVGRDLTALAQMAGDARNEATSSESRAENKYDTRATEASYLAAGQGRRLLGLRALAEWLEQLDPEIAPEVVGLGALVGLLRDGAPEWVLFGPEGGHAVVIDDVSVQLVSVHSPTGAALEGLSVGDAEEIETPRGTLGIEVHTIR